MSPRRLSAVAVVLLALAAVHFLFLRPNRRRGRLETVATAEQRLACCTSGARLEVCSQALRDLIDLSAGGDRVAVDARALRATCPASNELDAKRPHAPEQVLCGYIATIDERDEAARTLATGGSLGQVAGGACTAEGRRAALPAIASQFEKACGASACLDFLAGNRADPSVRSLVYGHSHKVVAALLARLEESRPIEPLASRQLLGFAAGDGAYGGPLSVVVNGGPGVAVDFVALLRDQPGPVLLTVLKTIAESKRTATARRAQLVLFALGQLDLTPAQEAAALDELDCSLLSALWPDLRLDEAERADAAAREPTRCPKEGLGLLADPLLVALTDRMLLGNWKLLERRPLAELRFEPAAGRMMHALLQRTAPPASAVRLASQVFSRGQELAEALKPQLRSPNPALRAAAAAALASTREEIPRDAAAACAHEQQAWLSCALTGATACALVCGGEPLTGIERLRLAEASRSSIPDPSLASASKER